jgi:hypothetical protein
MVVKGSEFGNDTDKIVWALTFFKEGIAGTWAENAVRIFSAEAIGEEDPDDHDHLHHWEDFLKEIKRIFGDVDEQQTAQSEFRRMRMGADTADEFNVKFWSLATRTGFNEEAQMDRYKRAITPRLLESVAHQGRWPTSLKDWMDMVSRLDHVDRDFQALRHERDGYSNRSFPVNPRSSAFGAFAAASRPLPPRPAATPPSGGFGYSYRPPSGPPMPPRPSYAPPHPAYQPPARPPVASGLHMPHVKVEQADRMKSTRCFRCGQLGHMANTCRNPPSNIQSMSWEEIRAMVFAEEQGSVEEMQDNGPLFEEDEQADFGAPQH